MTRRIALLLAAALLASPAYSQKNRNWQEGNLESATMQEERSGISSILFPYPATIRWWLYTIDTADLIYEFRTSYSYSLNVTVHRPIRFALDKEGYAYILDDARKEQKVLIRRKIAKQPTSAENWKTGRLIGAELKAYGGETSVRQWTYTIESADLIIELYWPGTESLNVTVNTPVRYFVTKENAVLLKDDDGREVRIELFRKQSRQPAAKEGSSPN